MERKMRDPFAVCWNWPDLILIFFGPFFLISFFDFLGVSGPLVSGFLQAFGFLLFTWIFINLSYRFSFWDNKFLPLWGQFWSIAILGIVLWFLGMGLNLIFQLILNIFWGLSPQPQQIVVHFMETLGSLDVLFYGVLVVVLGPLAEEVFFRGLLYPYLRAKMGIILAVVVSSLLFSLVHWEFWSLFPTFIAGIGFAFIFEKARTLWAPVLAHVIWNFMGIIGVFVSIGIG